MNPDTLNELKDNDDVRKRLAKFMAHFCFRNSKLEDFHDRISDDEMKALMIDVVNHCYMFIWAMFRSQGFNEIIERLKHEEQLPRDWKHWNDPEVSDEVLKAAKVAKDLLSKL